MISRFTVFNIAASTAGSNHMTASKPWPASISSTSGELVPKGPYFLGGFSSGGVAAYELAQQLLGLGEEVSVLVFFDTINPAGGDRSLRDRLVRHYMGARKAGAGYLVNRIKSRIQHDVELFRLYGKAHLSHFRAFDYRHEAVSAAWTSAERRYQPRQYPGHIALFKARNEAPELDGVHLTDASNGWQPFVTGALEVVDIEADHVALVHEQHARATAVELQRVLLQARERAERPARPRAAAFQNLPRSASSYDGP